MFKEKGYTATSNKLDKNLIGRNVVGMLSLSARSITHTMMQISLAYLMFPKRKKCGKIKARGCVNGRSQREYITKLESSFPCVKTYTLFLSCVVDTFENRCVAVANISAVFLSTDWTENIPDYYIFDLRAL